jgi:integrase/recombinase XerD
MVVFFMPLLKHFYPCCYTNVTRRITLTKSSCNMNIHFNLELSSRASSQSEKSILIRLTQNRQHRRVSTGIQVEEKHWDPKGQKIRKNHPIAAEYNGILQAKLKELNGVYSKLLQDDPSITADDIIRHLSRTKTTNFFGFAYSTKMAEIKSSNKMGTYRRYEAVLSKLEVYAGKSLSIKRVNYTFLKEYSLYLKTKLKNTDDTVSANLSVIRTIINEAIRHGLYTDNNPFDQVQLKYTDNTKEKLTAEELKRIFNTPLPQIPSLLLARDFFLACFLAEGTRAGDMMLMQPGNIINNCLVFQQQKTGTQMVIPIVPELQEIIDRYHAGGRFIFPFLNNSQVINEQVINSRITFANKYLKEVAKYCNIFKKISTHVSRHTFTDLALQATNENIYLVQKSLGHGSVRTTEIYSRNRVNFERSSPIPVILKKVKICNT